MAFASSLFLSRSHFCEQRQRQPSSGSHNCRLVKATRQARSCVTDPIFPGEFTRAGAREHDGALRRFEYRRHLMFAGTELDLKGAFWEWSIYSHLDNLSERRGPVSQAPFLRTGVKCPRASMDNTRGLRNGNTVLPERLGHGKKGPVA